MHFRAFVLGLLALVAAEEPAVQPDGASLVDSTDTEEHYTEPPPRRYTHSQERDRMRVCSSLPPNKNFRHKQHRKMRTQISSQSTNMRITQAVLSLCVSANVNILSAFFAGSDVEAMSRCRQLCLDCSFLVQISS